MAVLRIPGRFYVFKGRILWFVFVGLFAWLFLSFLRNTFCHIRDDQFYPKVQFQLLDPDVSPVGVKNETFYLVVVVNSDPRKLENRQTIRETWGSSHLQREYTISNRDGVKWGVFFAMGKTGDTSLDSKTTREAQIHNDILIGNFRDTYNNLIIKTFMSHRWTVTLKCKFVLKTDDDVYVRLNVFTHWLRLQGSPDRFYGGDIFKDYRVIRDRCSKWRKWAISKAYFSENFYPPYCGGPFHVISSDIVPYLLSYTSLRRPFHVDDAYIGIAMRDLGVEAIGIPGFAANYYYKTIRREIRKRKNLKDALHGMVAIGHGIEPELLRSIHDNYYPLTAA